MGKIRFGINRCLLSENAHYSVGWGFCLRGRAGFDREVIPVHTASMVEGGFGVML